MCLIIETQPSIKIPKFVMEDMFKRNNDGFGFMYIRDNAVIGEKYHSNNLDELYDKYLELQEFAPFIHLRMKTHGDISEEQSHPFYCGHGIWMMHNGILSNVQGEDKTKSDTWYFANDYLKPMFDLAKDPSEMLANEIFQIMVTRYIGSNNRIVIMDKKGGLRFNDDAWHVITNEETKCEGMRVSNTYAWSMHTKVVTHPMTRSSRIGGTSTSRHYAGSTGSTYEPARHGGSNIIVPPGFPKTESKPNDPPGSFRDQTGELWVYTGRGWMMSKRYTELYPNDKSEFTQVNGGGEVSQSHPTFPRTAESDLSKSGIKQRNEKFDESSRNERRRNRNGKQTLPSTNEEGDDDERYQEYSLDLYQDYLYDEWGSLTYKEVCERVKEDPEGAADIVAFCLAIKIEVNNEA